MILTEKELFDTLMALLKVSTPYQHEQKIMHLLPPGGEIDAIGNYWLNIDGNRETLFCCHLDTVGGKAKNTEPFYYEGNIYAMNPDASCLGGDDRCGILCLIALYTAGVPGTYVFHVGEERGCIGSKYAAKTYDMGMFKRAIQFDRRGTTSVITVMIGSAKVCSNEFSLELCKQLGLGFKQDDGGLFTDVYEYEGMIAEVTNVSCGYHNEHSAKEYIEADWLIKEFIPKLYDVKWETLPTVRDPKANNRLYEEYPWYSSYGGDGCYGFVGGSRKRIYNGGSVYNGTNKYSSGSTTSVGGGSKFHNSDKYSDNDYSKRNAGKIYDSYEEYAEFNRKFDPDYVSSHLGGSVNNNQNDNDDEKNVDSLVTSDIIDNENEFEKCDACNEYSKTTIEHNYKGQLMNLCDECFEFVVLNLDDMYEDSITENAYHSKNIGGGDDDDLITVETSAQNDHAIENSVTK